MLKKKFDDGLTNKNIELHIQLLKNVEIKFSTLWQRPKGKKLDEIYKGDGRKGVGAMTQYYIEDSNSNFVVRLAATSQISERNSQQSAATLKK